MVVKSDQQTKHKNKKRQGCVLRVRDVTGCYARKTCLLFVTVLQALTGSTENPACVVASGKTQWSSLGWNLIACVNNSQAKLQVKALVILFQERWLKVSSHSLETNAPNNKRFQGHWGAKSFHNQTASNSTRSGVLKMDPSIPPSVTKWFTNNYKTADWWDLEEKKNKCDISWWSDVTRKGKGEMEQLRMVQGRGEAWSK